MRGERQSVSINVAVLAKLCELGHITEYFSWYKVLFGSAWYMFVPCKILGACGTIEWKKPDHISVAKGCPASVFVFPQATNDSQPSWLAYNGVGVIYNLSLQNQAWSLMCADCGNSIYSACRLVLKECG